MAHAIHNRTTKPFPMVSDPRQAGITACAATIPLGTPRPELTAEALAKPRAIAPVLLPDPGAETLHDTRLGIASRSAVLQAIARIEAQRGDGIGHQAPAVATSTVNLISQAGRERIAHAPTQPAALRRAGKLLAFAIASAIAVVGLGYLATAAFFAFDHSWVVPTIGTRDAHVVALVPDDNFAGVAPGAPVFACSVGVVVCHEVGHVVDVRPGAIQFQHPHRDATVRGRMLELQLAEADAARHDVLFVGEPPLVF